MANGLRNPPKWFSDETKAKLAEDAEHYDEVAEKADSDGANDHPSERRASQGR
jgi:hypothetical protein